MICPKCKGDYPDYLLHPLISNALDKDELEEGSEICPLCAYELQSKIHGAPVLPTPGSVADAMYQEALALYPPQQDVILKQGEHPNEFKYSGGDDGLWIEVGEYSVYIHLCKDGDIETAIFPRGFEDEDNLAEASVELHELSERLVDLAEIRVSDDPELERISDKVSKELWDKMDPTLARWTIDASAKEIAERYRKIARRSGQ